MQLDFGKLRFPQTLMRGVSLIDKMRLLLTFIVVCSLGVSISALATSVPDNFTPEGVYSWAMKELKSAENLEDRFYALTQVSISTFEVGKIEDARSYAEELLSMAPSFQSNWNYGNAIHKGNIVLGRIALLNDDIYKANEYLRRAGETPGSPQLDSFGPNMTLAKELLEKSETESVKKYLLQCENFWETDRDKLEFWAFQIDKGEIPDFGANLLY